MRLFVVPNKVILPWYCLQVGQLVFPQLGNNETRWGGIVGEVWLSLHLAYYPPNRSMSRFT